MATSAINGILFNFIQFIIWDSNKSNYFGEERKCKQMNNPKLAELKKELQYREVIDLKELCLKLAKYKTENKELLNYLLFYSDRKDDYVFEVKTLLASDFTNLYPSIYYVTKQLRKLIRVMNKHIKYIGEKDKEVEITLSFCELFMESDLVYSNHKALIGLLFRQLKRVNKLLPKLQDDLQFDFQQAFDLLITELKKKRTSFQMWEIQ
jgi:hypothetical protein